MSGGEGRDVSISSVSRWGAEVWRRVIWDGVSFDDKPVSFGFLRRGCGGWL
jgi:hypothetical protein